MVNPQETQFTSQNPHSIHLFALRTPSTISFVDDREPSDRVRNCPPSGMLSKRKSRTGSGLKFLMKH